MKFEEKNAKIYSRPRINIVGILTRDNRKTEKRNNSKIKNINKIIIIITIAIITAIVIIKSISPIIEQLCIDEGKNIATKIANEEASKIIKKYSYDDLISITKDKNDNITMIQANIAIVNDIISDIPLNIVKQFEQNINSTIKFYLGSLLRYKKFFWSRSKNFG